MSMRRSVFHKSLPSIGVLALVVLLLFAFTTPASAATLCVNTGGTDGCYASIQSAVNAAGDGDTIEVHTGTYNESVDLAQAVGDIAVVAVDGTGTVTVNGGGNPAFHTSVLHSGDATIDGFTANSTGDHAIVVGVNSSVSISYVSADSSNGNSIFVYEAHGEVNISDCDAGMNSQLGIKVLDVTGDVTIVNSTATATSGFHVERVSGSVDISGCDASEGYHGGFYIAHNGGPVTIRQSSAIDNHWSGFEVFGTGGDVSITDSTARGNGWWQPFTMGFNVSNAGGRVTITNCTADGNRNEGFKFTGVDGRVTVDASVSIGNSGSGVLLGDVGSVAGTHLVSGSIICGNGRDGLSSYHDVMVNATGNWWGCPGGPGNPGCDTVDPGPGTVSFDPWIDTITASGPASAMAGEATVVTFQFSNAARTVFLGGGPGDLHGDPTFMVTTDNGTITEGGFVNAPDGVMEVTLVPEHGGTATVWVDGPCGLDDSIVLDVESEFVPEPGTLLLLGSGLMGLAGYASLRLRER